MAALAVEIPPAAGVLDRKCILRLLGPPAPALPLGIFLPLPASASAREAKTVSGMTGGALAAAAVLQQ